MTIGFQPVAVLLMETVFIAIWILGGIYLLK